VLLCVDVLRLSLSKHGRCKRSIAWWRGLQRGVLDVNVDVDMAVVEHSQHRTDVAVAVERMDLYADVDVDGGDRKRAAAVAGAVVVAVGRRLRLLLRMLRPSFRACPRRTDGKLLPLWLNRNRRRGEAARWRGQWFHRWCWLVET